MSDDRYPTHLPPPKDGDRWLDTTRPGEAVPRVFRDGRWQVEPALPWDTPAEGHRRELAAIEDRVFERTVRSLCDALRDTGASLLAARLEEKIR